MFITPMAPAQEIVAHRGFSARAPENTLSAFRLAWESGTNACELDLHLTADQQIVIMHDADTKRTTGIAKRISESTLADLRPLDAGTWKSPDYKGEPIPTLSEALATLPEGPQRFFLEIKCGPEVVPVLAQQLEAWKPRAKQLCIIAFDRKVAQDSKKALPWLDVYRLSSEQTKDKIPVDLATLIQDTLDDQLDGLDLSRKWNWTPELVQQIRKANLKLFAWTVNDPAEARHLASLGIDGITTDDPTATRSAITTQP
jgi:glycerophosphoryl diester phosphodiesterase